MGGGLCARYRFSVKVCFPGFLKVFRRVIFVEMGGFCCRGFCCGCVGTTAECPMFCEGLSTGVDLSGEQ